LRKTTELKRILFGDDSNIGVVASTLSKKKKRSGVNDIQMWEKFSPFSAVRWKFTLFLVLLVIAGE
jgi:hypothetical protein